MWTGHTISFSEATFIMSVCVVLPVLCFGSPEALFPSGNMSTNTGDSSLASTEAARAAYMQRDGISHWVEPASAAAERKREKEYLLSKGDGMSSSLQAGHQLASGGNIFIHEMF